MLDFLAGQGIGSHSSGQVSFSDTDRMMLAIECITKGCDVEEISALLNWKDFEQLASEILRASGYQTATNVRFTKPRMEIDVVGTMSSLAIAVDCKHWRSYSRASISGFAEKQTARAARLFEKSGGKISRAVPLILTLHDGAFDFVGHVPVVPVTQFRSFISEVESYLPEILLIENR